MIKAEGRPRLALVLIAVAALLPAVSLLLELGQIGWRRRDDAISAFDRRLAPLRDAVRGQEAIGYLPPGGSLEAPGGAAHFYMTRYALAPVIVVAEQQQPMIVADGVGDRGRLPPDLEIARDFGGGLFLLRPRAR
jgi:hypothetical protein